MYANLASCISPLQYLDCKNYRCTFEKIRVILWSRLEYDAILFLSLSPECFGSGRKHILPVAYATYYSLTWLFILVDEKYLIPTDRGQIMWFVTLTVTRARPPSTPCDASYPSGVTFPPRWASPSCKANNFADFSCPLLKRTHFADKDDRVIVDLRHNHARNRVKNDTRHVSPHLKL